MFRTCGVHMIRSLKEKIRQRMGLKFAVALTGVIFALMMVGTVFVSRMLLEDQYRHLETRGRELGGFLGKTAVDYVLFKEYLKIDDLVSFAIKSQDVLYSYVSDATGKALNNFYSSFNTNDDNVRLLLSEKKTEDVVVMAGMLKEKLGIIEVSVNIDLEGSRICTVVIGFTKSGVRKDIGKVAALLFGTSIGIVLVLAALAYFMVRRMIVSPTEEAVAAASNIAAGDLTQSVKVRSNDELGSLGRGLNRMIIGLKGMIGNAQEAVQNVGAVSSRVEGISGKITNGSREQSEAVEEAASSVNEMHFSLKDIAENVEDLYQTSERTSSSVLEMTASVNEVANTMTDLSSSIEETSTAIIQMNSVIRQIAVNVEELSTAAEQTAASASEISASVREVESTAKQSASVAEAVASDAQQLGIRSIEKTIEGMGRIESASRRTAEVVNRLGERAESIGSILTVIEDITDQTGLLALNAAILAAQAGEHGKGFAVVAGEIRGLANRTASSTQEIGKLITAVQEETKDAVDAMRQGVIFAEEGLKLSRDAGEALRKILERAERSREMSIIISNASVEQANGVRQVSAAVDKINEMTHQIARATNEQKLGSEQIMRASERMSEITRFVRNATSEQAKGSKDITNAVESMSTKVGLVNRAAGEVRAGSDLIVKAIERIKTIVKDNSELASGLDQAVDMLAKQAGSLKKSIEKFRTE